MKLTAEDLLARIQRKSSLPSAVIPRSTPVVSFGDCLNADVATLGINPSSAEFLGRGGLLTGNLARLMHLESDNQEIDRNLALEVLNASNLYWTRRPYGWFNQLNKHVLNPLGFDYASGSAVHLDICQVATRPVWGQLSSVEQTALISEDLPFLKLQIERGSYKAIYLNGRTVLNTVMQTGLVELELATSFAREKAGKCEIYVGQSSDGTRFVGWSLNIQNRATPKDKQQLTQILKTL